MVRHFSLLLTYLWLRFFLFPLKNGISIPNTTAMIECTEWEFNTTDSLGNTWTSEWKLVCDKKYLKIVAEMIFLVGVATGGIVSGMLSDKFGRKKMLFISAVFQSFFGKSSLPFFT
jgi:MFS family permease